jgi:Cohesin domain
MKRANYSLSIVGITFILLVFSTTIADGQCTYPDVTKPIARCRNITVYLDSTGQAGIDPRDIDAGSSDNCSPWYLILEHPCFYCSDIGNKNVTLYVQDRAGNQSSCNSVLTIRDTMRPRLSLRTDIAVNIGMNGGTTGRITAQQMINSALDNCTRLDRIQATIRKAGQGTGYPTATELLLTCADTGRYAVEVWVKDSLGNMTSRTGSLLVRDNNKVCTPVAAPIVPAIIGKIRTETGKAVSANVTLNGATMATPMLYINSDYMFGNLTRGGTYNLTPARDTDWMNGVTTFDIALMSRHALGIETITDPYKLIAGDVNRDGYIDASDMLLTRKLVLRQNTRVAGNTAWRFVPAGYVFATPLSIIPGSFPEMLSISNISDTIRNADFIAIKTGDINQTANNLVSDIVAQPRNTKNWLLSMDNKALKAGTLYDLDVTAQDLSVFAYQMTLNYDTRLVKILSLEKGDIDNFNTSNFANFTEKGIATVSWNTTDNKVMAGNNIFKIRLQALQSTQLSDALLISSDLTPAQANNLSGESLSVNLAFKNAANTEGGDFHLFPSYPNPFRDETTIRFRLPQADMVKLTVFDETGRVLKTVNKLCEKGYSELPLDLLDKASSAVLFYRLETATHSAMQRLVIMR